MPTIRSRETLEAEAPTPEDIGELIVDVARHNAPYSTDGEILTCLKGILQTLVYMSVLEDFDVSYSRIHGFSVTYKPTGESIFYSIDV